MGANILLQSQVVHPDYDLTFHVVSINLSKQTAFIQADDILGLECPLSQLRLLSRPKVFLAKKDKKRQKKKSGFLTV